jgi:alpha-L-fucosidase
MRTPYLFLFILALTLIGCGQTHPPSTDVKSQPAVVDKMEWWREARFGMFIHWGLYSIPAGTYKGKQSDRVGEWIMNDMQIPIKEYEEFADQFNPQKFDASEWVSILKDAGMKYLVITSKHHDGFCLWDSKVSNYDIMDAAPFKRDILSELSEACEKEGIRFGLYHSIMDWHHPQAQAIWEPNYNKGRQDTLINPEFPSYYEDYLKPQVMELMSQYPTEILWFDGEWIPDYTSEMGKELYQLIVDKEPDMIINNRIDKGRQGMKGFNSEGVFAGDFGTPEQEIPDTGIVGVDWESCMTMNDTWGYKSFDHNWKSAESLIRNLIDIVSKGGNFLLNVGPKSDGSFPEASISRLQQVGNWMDKYSKSIYGTSPSPYQQPAWGRYAQKGDIIFAYVFDWPENHQLVIDPGVRVKKAYLLDDPDKSELQLRNQQEGLSIVLHGEAPDPVASVLVLEVE